MIFQYFLAWVFTRFTEASTRTDGEKLCDSSCVAGESLLLSSALCNGKKSVRGVHVLGVHQQTPSVEDDTRSTPRMFYRHGI
jgi:hypothetical protein